MTFYHISTTQHWHSAALGWNQSTTDLYRFVVTFRSSLSDGNLNFPPQSRTRDLGICVDIPVSVRPLSPKRIQACSETPFCQKRDRKLFSTEAEGAADAGKQRPNVFVIATNCVCTCQPKTQAKTFMCTQYN